MITDYFNNGSVFSYISKVNDLFISINGINDFSDTGDFNDSDDFNEENNNNEEDLDEEKVKNKKIIDDWNLTTQYIIILGIALGMQYLQSFDFFQ